MFLLTDISLEKPHVRNRRGVYAPTFKLFGIVILISTLALVENATNIRNIPESYFYFL